MKNRNVYIIRPAFVVRSTPFGPVVLLWSISENQPKIFQILLSKPGVSAEYQMSRLFPDSTADTCSEIDVLADSIEAFLCGEEIVFSLEILRMDLCSEFQQEVLSAEHGIPRGAVSTYQRIAGHLGRSKGARAVGNALAKNPFPILVPCHRAIRSDRSPGRYQGGAEMKRTLLEMEGIEFDNTGHVITKVFFY